MKQVFNVVAAIAIGSAAFIPAQASADVGFNIVIGNAPPPVRYEVVPAPRRGYEWAPGYWNWNGRRHRWAQGHWERARPGYAYQRPEWRQDGDKWRLNRGGWTQAENRSDYRGNRPDRDREEGRDHRERRDHDGASDRHDRDGDGIPNRDDRHPDNPRRD